MTPATAPQLLDTLLERTRAAIEAAKLERLLPTLDHIERTQRTQLLQMIEDTFAGLLEPNIESIGIQFGFDSVRDELLEQRNLKIFLPAISRTERGRSQKGAPRIIRLDQIQTSYALHLGPSSRPFQAIPGEPGDLYLLRSDAFKMSSPPWLTTEIDIIFQIISANDLLSGRVHHATSGKRADAVLDGRALRKHAARKNAPLLMVVVHAFFNIDHTGLTSKPHATSAFLERLARYYREHGQGQPTQEILRAVLTEKL